MNTTETKTSTMPGKAHLALAAQRIIHDLDRALAALVNGPVRISDKSNDQLSEHDPKTIAARAALAQAREVDATGTSLEVQADAAFAVLVELDALRDAARELVTRWDEVRRGLRDPSCLSYANELALAALAKGAK
jgi:hypothetical protein